MIKSKATPHEFDYVEFAKTMTKLAVTNALPKPGLVNIPQVSIKDAIFAWCIAAAKQIGKFILGKDKK